MPAGVYARKPPTSTKIGASVEIVFAERLQKMAAESDGSLSHALNEILRAYFNLQDSMSAFRSTKTEADYSAFDRAIKRQ